MHGKPLKFPQLYTTPRFIKLMVYLPCVDLFFKKEKRKKNTNTNSLMRKKYTHACTANWCTDALRLVTLQPIFSCRALNSPRRDGEPLAQQNRKWRSETDKQNRTGYFLSPLPLKSLFFYVLEIRKVKKTQKKTVLRMSAFLTNTE